MNRVYLLHDVFWISFRVYTSSVLRDNLNNYNAYGAAVSEVEVDVLTGEVQILRVDILYDCGQR